MLQVSTGVCTRNHTLLRVMAGVFFHGITDLGSF